MSTIATVIAGWFGFSIVFALLVGRVMSFAKRNDPPEMPLFLPAARAHLPMAYKPAPLATRPALVPAPVYGRRTQRSA